MAKDTFLEKLFLGEEEKVASYGQSDLSQEESTILAAASSRLEKQAELAEFDFAQLSDEQKDSLMADAVNLEKQAKQEFDDKELYSACDRIFLATDVGVATGRRSVQESSGGFLKTACFKGNKYQEFINHVIAEGGSKEDLIKLANDETALGEYAGEVAIEVAEMLKSGALEQGELFGHTPQAIDAAKNVKMVPEGAVSRAWRGLKEGLEHTSRVSPGMGNVLKYGIPVAGGAWLLHRLISNHRD